MCVAEGGGFTTNVKVSKGSQSVRNRKKQGSTAPVGHALYELQGSPEQREANFEGSAARRGISWRPVLGTQAQVKTINMLLSAAGLGSPEMF